jgi:hypothetical protein
VDNFVVVVAALFGGFEALLAVEGAFFGVGLFFAGADSFSDVVSAFLGVVDRLACAEGAFFNASSLRGGGVTKDDAPGVAGMLVEGERLNDLEGEGVIVRRIWTFLVGVVGDCDFVVPGHPVGLFGRSIRSILFVICRRKAAKDFYAEFLKFAC